MLNIQTIRLNTSLFFGVCFMSMLAIHHVAVMFPSLSSTPFARSMSSIIIRNISVGLPSIRINSELSPNFNRTSCPLEEFSIVSWNINLLRPSSSAPEFWRSDNSGDLVIKEKCLIDSIMSSPPDVIALQEMPTQDWASTWLNRIVNDVSYAQVGEAKPSHSGYVGIFVRQDLFPKSTKISHIPNNNPSVAVKLKLSMLPYTMKESEKDDNVKEKSVCVIVASSHLAPFNENAFSRLLQMQALLKSLINPNDTGHNFYIFAGDLNMRSAEDYKFENDAGVPLLDAWKVSGAVKDTCYTWDTFKNHFWPNGFRYRCRYDRIYFYNSISDFHAKDAVHLKVTKFGLVGDEPLLEHGGIHHYLSDHFGMRATFVLSQESNMEAN